MNYYIIIPAHNEEVFLADALNSILRQTLLPKKVIIVNDNSTDGTETIIDQFIANHSIFNKLNTQSSTEHMPGSKVINAFKKGLEQVDDNYEFIVKFDADIILPENYFEKIAYIFRGNPRVGIAGGFVYEEDSNNEWKLNHPMNKDHVRGAFKAYTKNCFSAIGGLKNAMGWDTLDELLARYHGFHIFTDDSLKVKHLRPTGKAYNAKAKLLQGEAMYTMGYGYWITFIASLKMAWKLKKYTAFFDNMEGFYNARSANKPFLVTKDEAKFIRKYRWNNIKRKVF
ncbi:glycosyltransferase family 2 protein [Aurantibacter crassamenti]|uniref:glycosyltransferase n=1 Tax=Aurantibacter crassamenti TaxID=1837375 RepID=UPI0019397388|nr:glycosyltransferase family 2 protein [Aurantibacter crassamenti]MBM1106070.1 glycosyltransferase family 2 protein [Aurantibacter crassamenti]